MRVESIITRGHMEVDQIITVRVKEVSDHIVKVDYNGRVGSVQIIDLTWRRGRIEPSEIVAVGDDVKVRVLAISEQLFSASIKDVYPDDEPWLNRPSLGDKVIGKVVTVTEYGYICEIGKNIWAVMLHEHSLSRHDKNSEVQSEVVMIDEERRKIELAEIG